MDQQKIEQVEDASTTFTDELSDEALDRDGRQPSMSCGWRKCFHKCHVCWREQ